MSGISTSTLARPLCTNEDLWSPEPSKHEGSRLFDHLSARWVSPLERNCRESDAPRSDLVGSVEGKIRSPLSEGLRDLFSRRLCLVARPGPRVTGASAGATMAIRPVQPLLVHAAGSFALSRQLGFPRRRTPVLVEHGGG